MQPLYLWQHAPAMHDHLEKILVVLYIPRPYIPHVPFVYKRLILSRMAVCCFFFGSLVILKLMENQIPPITRAYFWKISLRVVISSFHLGAIAFLMHEIK